jgi:hypothetical protein
MMPQRQSQVIAFDLDASVIVHGNHRHLDYRLPFLV